MAKHKPWHGLQPVPHNIHFRLEVDNTKVDNFVAGPVDMVALKRRTRKRCEEDKRRKKRS